MKITQLYVYPIKALRPISVQHAQLTPQGIKYDRTFMLYHVKTKVKTDDDGSSPTTSTELKKMQLSSYPQCALFEQTILSRDDGQKEVLVKWHAPSLPTDGLGSESGEELEKELEQAEREKLKRLETETITVELDPPPKIDELEKMEVDLHGSPTTCYKVGEEYDRWFSERFGFEVVFVYLGDGKRQILGTNLLPPATPHSHANLRRQSRQSTPQQQQPQQPGGGGGGGGGWLSTLTSLTSWFPTVPISVPRLIAIPAEREEDQDQKPWITFTDCAPLLITSESSLSNVSARLAPDSTSSESTPPQVPMYKMRPNLVLDGEGEEAWAEDYWGELVVTSSSNWCSPTNGNANGNTAKITKTKLYLTGNCVRCTSLNVDYDTGKPAKGEMGTVLKKLMKDRRVDPGMKWSPVFGRYAFVGETAVDDNGGDQEREEREPEVWISVGDEVEVIRRNEERTVMDWPI